MESKLAACVSILPGIESIYTWEEKLKTESEVQLLIKATQETFPVLEKVLSERHPYDTPEIIALTPSAASEAYGNWVTEQCHLPQAD